MTANKISFGFTIPQRGIFFRIATWPEMVALAREADACGLFDSIWVGDSLLSKPRADSLALLGALASVTEKARLGVGCMASFPVRDPIMFAYQWATLDLISNGRMLLAACTGIVAGGVSEREGLHWGVTDGERGPRMAENIAICRRLWSEDNVSFAGKFRSFAGITMRPRPVQQPCPIWIAANPPPTMTAGLKRVARLADGWMTVQLFPKMFASNWSKLCEFLKAEGREPKSYPNIEYHNININPDRNAALEESKRFLDEYYGPVFAAPMVECWTAAGTPSQCVSHLRELAADGAKAITLRITSWRQRDQYQRLVNEVLPYV